ncbi:MAG: GIY-YIG nuclease family protein [Methanomicrobiales archaeon]|nr:GIY-YIG nuclease family protein [Methanomicrobiales archaeon]
MDKGVYALVMENRACKINIGALGTREFLGGFHVYIGSALGPGGLARVTRHLRLAVERDRAPRWHIDHLLLADEFRPSAVVCAATTGRYECILANAVCGSPVPGFGASDCRCITHLFAYQSDPVWTISRVMSSLKLVSRVWRPPGEKHQVSRHL